MRLIFIYLIAPYACILAITARLCKTSALWQESEVIAAEAGSGGGSLPD